MPRFADADQPAAPNQLTPPVSRALCPRAQHAPTSARSSAPLRPVVDAVARLADARVEAEGVVHALLAAAAHHLVSLIAHQVGQRRAEPHAQRELVVPPARRQPLADREGAEPRARVRAARRDEACAVPRLRLRVEHLVAALQVHSLREIMLRSGRAGKESL